jgi:hypothetical protein
VVEHYLDLLTIRLRGYDGFPQPDNLSGEFELEVTVGSRVDVEQLAGQIDEDLRLGPRSVEQSIRKRSWGASGASAVLLIDVPAVLSGLASLPIIWDTMARRILHLGEPRILDADNLADRARSSLARDLNIGTDAIKVVARDPIQDGLRMELETPLGTYIVETEGQSVTRIRRKD